MRSQPPLTGKNRAQGHRVAPDGLIARGMARLLPKFLAPGEYNDQRGKYRKFCYIPSKFLSNSQTSSVIIRNISKEGAFIETRQPLQIGQEITLTVPFSFFAFPLTVPGLLKILPQAYRGYSEARILSRTRSLGEKTVSGRAQVKGCRSTPGGSVQRGCQ